MENVQELAVVTTSEALLAHWQGHRKLTRKVIEAFPENHFFSFNIGEMRPFAGLAMEIMDLTEHGIKGMVTGIYPDVHELPHAKGPEFMPKTKADFLKKWDEVTESLNEYWKQIPDEKFQEVEVAFGMYENKKIDSFFYYIDNEIHHRGQATVYLRALGVEPPMFWDRE
jgi:uncharacterized damage-inducible protein DinB